MPLLIDIRPATMNSNLLARVAAALEGVASQALAAATGPNDTNLSWVKRAWFGPPGSPPMIPWYAQRALEHALQQSAQLRAAVDLDKDNPVVSDADIQAFCLAFAQRCVLLNI